MSTASLSFFVSPEDTLQKETGPQRVIPQGLPMTLPFPSVASVDKATPLSFKASVQSKTTHLAYKIYDYIKNFFQHLKIQYIDKSFGFVADLLWPYQKKTEEELAKEQNSWLGQILQKGLELSEEKNQQTSQSQSKDEKSIPINTAMTVVGCAVNYGMVPYQIAQNYQNQGLVTTVITANVMQKIVTGCFVSVLDQKTLKKYDLIPETDGLDQLMYQGAVVLAFKGVSVIARQDIHQSIHFAVALLGTFPPVQNAIKRSTYGNQISRKSHELVDQSRTWVKKPLIVLFKKLIKQQIDSKGISFANNISNAVKNEVKSQLPVVPSGLKSLLGGPLGIITDDFVDSHVVQPMAEQIPVMIEATASKLADSVLNLAFSYTKNCFEVYFCNQALAATVATHPLLASVTLLVQGGPKQSLRELVFRVTGVSVMILTGSTLWPMLIIYTPKLVEYGVNLRGKHLKKQGILEDPALQSIQKITTLLMSWIPAKKVIKAQDSEESQLNACENEQEQEDGQITYCHVPLADIFQQFSSQSSKGILGTAYVPLKQKKESLTESQQMLSLSKSSSLKPDWFENSTRTSFSKLDFFNDRTNGKLLGNNLFDGKSRPFGILDKRIFTKQIPRAYSGSNNTGFTALFPKKSAVKLTPFKSFESSFQKGNNNLKAQQRMPNLFSTLLSTGFKA